MSVQDRMRRVGAGDVFRALGWVLLAPFRVLGLLWRCAVAVGIFFMWTLQVGAMGLLFMVCGGIVIASVVEQIYRYNHDPAYQLEIKEAELADWGRADIRTEWERKAHGLPALPPEQHLVTPAFEAEVARLRSEVAAQKVAAKKHGA